MAVATLHSSVIDFKFSTHTAQSNRIKLHDSDDEAQESSHTFMENGILVEKKLNMEQPQTTDDSSAAASGNNSSSKNSSPAGKRKKGGMRRQWHPHNIAEYFFFNDNGQLEVSEDTIRQTYSAYTTILSNAHKQLRKNYEDMVASAFGSHNPDAPMPLCVEPMKTFPLQHYLDEEMVNRLGFQNEVFQSGSFQVFNAAD